MEIRIPIVVRGQIEIFCSESERSMGKHDMEMNCTTTDDSGWVALGFGFVTGRKHGSTIVYIIGVDTTFSADNIAARAISSINHHEA